MQSHKRTAILAFAILILVILTTMKVIHGQGQDNVNRTGQENINNNQSPITDYENSEPIGSDKRALRRIRGSRYTRGNNQVIKELPVGIEELPSNSNWWWGLPAIPATSSDVIVVGEISAAQAFLSNDKTAVYSEFTIRIEGVLKNSTNAQLDDTIVAERTGGAVRFKSGRIQYYRIDKQGVPQVGRRYLFFLKRSEDGQDFSILTGYELRAGQVFALDGAGNSANNKLPFDKYNGCEESAFLNEVRNVIANLQQVLPEKGRQN
jgi:hypothetical protein